MIFTILLILLLAVVVLFRVSLDITEDNKLLLWYNGKNERKYIRIL